MFKRIFLVSMILMFFSSAAFSTQVPSVEDNVRSIETICKKYYDRNEDCPFDDIIGVPKSESRTNRFDVIVDSPDKDDTKDVEVKPETFRSN